MPQNLVSRRKYPLIGGVRSSEHLKTVTRYFEVGPCASLRIHADSREEVATSTVTRVYSHVHVFR